MPPVVIVEPGLPTVSAPSVVGCCADDVTTSNSITGLPVPVARRAM